MWNKHLFKFQHQWSLMFFITMELFVISSKPIMLKIENPPISIFMNCFLGSEITFIFFHFSFFRKLNTSLRFIKYFFMYTTFDIQTVECYWKLLLISVNILLQLLPECLSKLKLLKQPYVEGFSCEYNLLL